MFTMYTDANGEVKRVTKQDKKEICSMLFLRLLLVAAVTAVAVGVLFTISARRAEKELGAVLDSVSAYLCSATDQEFSGFSEKFRNDMILLTFGEENAQFVELIPNTAESCGLEAAFDAEGPVLFYLNTGEFYAICPRTDGTDAAGTFSLLGSGYDEVSGTRHSGVQYDGRKADVYLTRAGGEVSIHRLKTLCCDACIERLADALGSYGVSEAAVIDPATDTIYPIRRGERYEMDVWTVSVASTDFDHFEINVSSVTR